MYWKFKNIPKDQGPEILDLYQAGNYQEIIKRFLDWEVIPPGCGSCGLLGALPGFMEYAIYKDLIPSKHEKEPDNQKAGASSGSPPGA
jgi:hypothetical protein